MKLKANGFTLIEIMVTLLLSSVIIGAIGRVFNDSRSAFNRQNAMSYMVEDGRYILDVFGKEFRRAGYLKNAYAAGQTANDIFQTDAAVMGSNVSLQRGAFIGGIYNQGGFNDEYDINHVVIRYQLHDVTDLSNALSPCTRDLSTVNFADTDNVVLTLYFYIQNVQVDKVNSTPVLYCKAKMDTITFDAAIPPNPIVTPLAGPTAAVPLLSNVEKMYVVYGVDTENTSLTAANDGTVRAANMYVTADQVNQLDLPPATCLTNGTVVSCWTKIISTRFYLVLRSEDADITTNGAQNYLIDGWSYPVNHPEDNRLYRVFSTTLTSRNQ